MFPCSDYGLTAHPVHLGHILASQNLSDVSKHFWRRLLFLLLLALQRVETQRFVCADGVDVGAGVHESGMGDCGAVVDDLVERIFLLGLRRVENVDQTVCAG